MQEDRKTGRQEDRKTGRQHPTYGRQGRQQIQGKYSIYTEIHGNTGKYTEIQHLSYWPTVHALNRRKGW